MLIRRIPTLALWLATAVTIVGRPGERGADCPMAGVLGPLNRRLRNGPKTGRELWERRTDFWKFPAPQTNSSWVALTALLNSRDNLRHPAVEWSLEDIQGS